MSIIATGIDLAKHIFALHGVNESGQAELVKPCVAREQLVPLIAPHHREVTTGLSIAAKCCN